MSSNEYFEFDKKERSFDNRKLIALLCCIFLGRFGIHRFYLGKILSGIVMLVICLLGYGTFIFLIGIPLIKICKVWAIIDFFLILTDILK